MVINIFKVLKMFLMNIIKKIEIISSYYYIITYYYFNKQHQKYD